MLIKLKMQGFVFMNINFEQKIFHWTKKTKKNKKKKKRKQNHYQDNFRF